MGSLLTSKHSQKLVAAAAIHVERAGARVRVVELQVHVSSIIVLVSRHLLDGLLNRVFHSWGDDDGLLNGVFHSWGDDFLHFQIRSLDHQLSWRQCRCLRNILSPGRVMRGPLLEDIPEPLLMRILELLHSLQLLGLSMSLSLGMLLLHLRIEIKLVLILLVSELLLLIESLRVRVSLMVKPFVVLRILVCKNRVWLSNLLEACGLREVFSDVVELMRLTKGLVGALFLTMLAGTDCTVDLHRFLILCLGRFAKDFS